MESLGTGGRWIDLLQPIVRELNSRKIRGTSFRAKDIDANNAHRFLAEKLNISDVPALLNTLKINARTIKNKRWLKRMFRYERGARVLLSADLVGKKRGPFRKPSVEGYFAEQPYLVQERFLATTRDLELIPGGAIFFVKGT